MKVIKSAIDGRDVRNIQLFPTFIRITFMDGGFVEIFATMDATLEVHS